MPFEPFHLLRCDHCFVLRIEQQERPCPICTEGTLKITATKFNPEKIDIHPVQDLLKRMMKAGVGEEQLVSEVINVINVARVVEEVNKKINEYLFYGHPISLQLPASIINEINIVAADSVSSLMSEARTIAQAVRADDTDSIIKYVQIKRTAAFTQVSSNDILAKLQERWGFVATNQLVCCSHCMTLYRSFGMADCIFCGNTSVYPVLHLTSPHASGSEILSKLIQSAEESKFENIQPVLSSFILTYHLSKKEMEPKTIIDIKQGIQTIQWKVDSLMEIHAQIYDLLEGLKPLQQRQPNAMYSPNASVFEELPNEAVAGAIINTHLDQDSVFEPPEPDHSLSASLFSPFEVLVEESFLIQVFVHEVDMAEKIKELAVSADADSAKRFESSLNINAAELKQLDISFVSDDIAVDERTYSMQWQGGVSSVQFIGTIPKNCTKANIFGKIIMAANSVPIGQMKFKIKVMTGLVKDKDQPLPINAIPFEKYKRIFISYASEDRSEVLKRVQILKAMKVDFFQDILSIEPGDNWEETLYAKIQASDAFFLFWSSAAASSSWVKKEIIYAINIKRGKEENRPHIIPIIIEGPPPPAPPPELAFLHFNDQLLYFMN